MDDLAPAPTQPLADHDRNQPDQLMLPRKPNPEKKARPRRSKEEREKTHPDDGHQLDILA
jgi:hypothetical protein